VWAVWNSVESFPQVAINKYVVNTKAKFLPLVLLGYCANKFRSFGNALFIVRSTGSDKKDSTEERGHPFHLVTLSPFPLTGSIGALLATLGLAMWFHGREGGTKVLLFGIWSLILTIVLWFRDIIREGAYEGVHTLAVQVGLRYGMVLFITTEVVFFFSFFWTYFSAALAPTIEIGGIFPPVGIQVFNAAEVPLLNTSLLLLSGASVTWAHHGLVAGYRKQALNGLVITVFLGLMFTLCQVLEYVEACFTLSDGIYGSTFFLLTGFHGAHVLIGTIMLFVCLIRQWAFQFTREHHIGFNFAAAYWHFVDVVWIGLYCFVYVWAGIL